MDLFLVTWINHRWGVPFWDGFFWFLSWMPFLLGMWVVVIGIAVWMKKLFWKGVLISFLFSFVLFWSVSELGCKKILVNIVGERARPYVAHQDIMPRGFAFADSSFPSSHMVSTVALLMVLALVFSWSWGVLVFALGMSLLMGISRMYNGMHYPSDVLVGMVLGVLCGRGGVRLGKLLYPLRAW